MIFITTILTLLLSFVLQNDQSLLLQGQILNFINT